MTSTTIAEFSESPGAHCDNQAPAAQVLRPRCFFIATTLEDNPVPHHFMALSKRLVARGHRVVLLTPHRKLELEDHAGNPVVSNANYAALIAGGGIKYHVNNRWDLALSMVWSPENTKEKQPVNSFWSGGFSYKILPLEERENHLDL